MGNNSKKKKKSSKKARRQRNRIIIFAIEVVILAVIGVVLWWVLKGTSKNKRVDLSAQDVKINDGVEDLYDQVAPGSKKGASIADTYTQIALFGVDSREGNLNSNTRTDTIIIASINNENNEIKLCSVYRDTYLNLSNDSYNKCNSAYANGGPEQAINMLNMNMDLNITKYVTVGFKGVVETVDALGGVPIDVSDAEIHYLNDYQYCIAQDLGYGENYTKVVNSGMQTLNGLQACAYCRIRYTKGDDFKRAERQRTVVTEMTEIARTANVSELSSIATSAFENVSTNFTLDDILGYVADASKFKVVASDGFPFTDYRTTGTIGAKGSCVIPTDLTTNVTLLHDFLYGVKDYDPTDTVKECSEKIQSDTSAYLH